MNVDVCTLDVTSQCGVGSTKSNELLVQLVLLVVFPVEIFAVKSTWCEKGGGEV